MRHKHVRMIIRQDGSCAVDAVNFTDATCTQATRQILAGVGGAGCHRGSAETRSPAPTPAGKPPDGGIAMTKLRITPDGCILRPMVG